MAIHDWRRTILGIMAVVMACIAAWLNYFSPEVGERYAAIAAGSLRMTPILAVLWLALPEKFNGPRLWIFVGVAVCAVAFLFRPGRAGVKFLVPMLIGLAALAFLRRITAALTGENSRSNR